MGTGADVALESADQIRGGKSGGIVDPVVGHRDDPRLRAQPLDQLGLLLRQHRGLELGCESVAAAMRAAVALSPVSMTMRRDAFGRDRSERLSLELIGDGEQRQRLAVTADERRGRSLRPSPRTAMSTPATILRRFLRPLTGSTPRFNAWLCCGPACAAGKAYGNALALSRAQRADADPAQVAPPKLSCSRHHGRVQSLVQARGI
jgi:hypothetical protein